MSWYRYNGKILKRDGGIAISANCCCDCNCQCPELTARWHADHNLRLTVSGGITHGPCDDWPVSVGIGCNGGEVWGAIGIPCNAPTECIGLNWNLAYLYCAPDGHGLNEIICEIGSSNLGCQFGGGNRPIRAAGQVAKTPDVIICDPEQSPSFYAKYVFTLEPSEPGGCGDCPSTVTFEWESFGPLP